jgi:hypothetical protein
MVGSVASAEPEALREATEEPVALTGSGEAVPATLVEVPLAPPFVTVVPVGNAALAAVTVVQVLSFPRPEQVTSGFLAALAEEELDLALLALEGAGAARLDCRVGHCFCNRGPGAGGSESSLTGMMD